MDESIKDEILQAAKEEFLTFGYQEASMRNIASKAKLTTGSLYYRFIDKAELFDAIVGQDASNLLNMFIQAQENFATFSVIKQIKEMESYTHSKMKDMIDYIYNHFDSFQLIICKSNGSKYEYFIDSMVDIEVKNTKRFIQDLKKKNIPVHDVDDNLNHILCTSLFRAIFEVVVHQMQKKEAIEYIDKVYRFYEVGWMELLGVKF